ncbi:uncharacterized protein A4U43_C08F4370 [Asparagus officinalis]|nr:uncharacterized protein A4U43_C08F4370 [Asparagus officinalis]
MDVLQAGLTGNVWDMYGYYASLVPMARDAFLVDELVQEILPGIKGEVDGSLLPLMWRIFLPRWENNVDFAMLRNCAGCDHLMPTLFLEWCKSFWRASKEKLVCWFLAVDKESRMQWWEKDAYLALLQNCTNCDNLNTNFVLGMEEPYNLNRANSGLQHLHHAMDGGHLNAAYFMGMVLFRHGAGTRSDATKILNKVSSGDLSSRYNDRSSDGWVKDDQRPRAFCSQVCRWTYECHLFFRNI